MTSKQERNLKKELKAEADRVWHRCCLKMWGNICFFDKSEKKANGHIKIVKHSHHLFPKGGGYGWLRYCIEIGVPICWPCHNKLEQGGDKSMQEQIIEIRGKVWFDKIKKMISDRKTSFETISWYAENIIRMKKYLNEPVDNSYLTYLKK